MTLRYLWKDMEVNIPNNYGETPHTHKEIRDIEHEYDRVVKTNDICDYLFPNLLKKGLTPSEIMSIGFYMRKVANFLQESAKCDLEELESDEYFVEFMKDRYEEQALEEWRERNERY